MYSTGLVDRLLGRVVPQELQGSGTLDEQRAKLLVLSCFGTGLLGPLFAVIFWFTGNLWLIAPMLGGAVLVATPPLLLRSGVSFTLVGNWLALQSYLALCAMIWISGGPSPEALVWLLYVPICALVFANRRSGGIWTAVVVLTCLGVYWIDANVYTFPNKLEEDSPLIAIGGPIALILLVSLLFSLHTRLQKWLISSLEEVQQRALRASEESFQTLIEHSPDAIMVLHDQRPEYVNQAFVDMLGYSLAELREIDPSAVTPGYAYEDALRHERALLEGAQPDKPREGIRIRKDGTKLDVEVRTFSTTFRGERAVIVSLRDITERKHLQAKMMQMDRMIAVGTLAAGVAHEINNPLAFITANASLLRAESERGTFESWEPPSDSTLDEEELREILADITEGGERIRQIVSGLRSFARVNDDDKTTDSVNLNDLLDSCVKMAHHEIKHRARLVTDFDEVSAVRGDNASLGQVFLNLIVNAAHAIPPGNRDNNQIRIRVHQIGNAACVEVSDTGTGMTDEVKARIFDPFFSTKSDRDGMGLGLYITQNIVHEHAGELTCETESGRGTTFRVRLPLTDKKPSDITGPLPVASAEPARGTILVIDDEARILRTLERALPNFEVTTAESALEALEVMRDGCSFDVVLCDLLMPQMSGMDFFERAKADLPGVSDRLVFMTGGTFTAEAREFVAQCGCPVVPKPFDINKLRHLLEERLAEVA